MLKRNILLTITSHRAWHIVNTQWVFSKWMNEWMNQMKQYVWKDFVNCELLFVGEWLPTVIITKSASKLLWPLIYCSDLNSFAFKAQNGHMVSHRGTGWVRRDAMRSFIFPSLKSSRKDPIFHATWNPCGSSLVTSYRILGPPGSHYLVWDDRSGKNNMICTHSQLSLKLLP